MIDLWDVNYARLSRKVLWSKYKIELEVVQCLTDQKMFVSSLLLVGLQSIYRQAKSCLYRAILHEL